MNSLPPRESPKIPHSSSLIWAILLMVMLTGLLYLGFKMKQQRIEKQTTPLNTLAKSLPVNANTHTPPNENMLTTLQAQKISNPVVYKVSIFLHDDSMKGLNQNGDFLWQQGQKQLTSVKATVHAGIDLSELNVQSLTMKTPLTLQLPPARLGLIQIDNITVYDIKTGQPSTVQLGLSLTSAQDRDIKAQILREFCQSDLLKITTDNTRQHVVSLSEAMNLALIVQAAEPMGCVQSAS